MSGDRVKHLLGEVEALIPPHQAERTLIRWLVDLATERQAELDSYHQIFRFWHSCYRGILVAFGAAGMLLPSFSNLLLPGWNFVPVASLLIAICGVLLMAERALGLSSKTAIYGSAAADLRRAVDTFSLQLL